MINQRFTPEFYELSEYLFSQLRAQHINRMQIEISLVRFCENFDLDAMHRFYKWAQDQELSNSEITATLVHDLNGRNQDPHIFSPRTSSY